MNTKDLLGIAIEIAKHCWEADHNFSWDQKKVVDKESRLIPKTIQKNYKFFEES